MERTQIFDLMGELKLYGMKAAFDEIMATSSRIRNIKRTKVESDRASFVKKSSCWKGRDVGTKAVRSS